MYPVSMALVKMALSLVLHRVFQAKAAIRAIVWVIAGFTIIASLITSIFVAATCGTMASLTPVAPHCPLLAAYNAIGTFFAAANTFTDLILVILAVVALWNVQMTRWKKISTLVLFLLGMMTWVISLTRLIWTYGMPEKDWTAAHNTKSVFFSIVEIFAGITGTSLSGIRPLARLWQAKIKTSLHYQSRASRATGNPSLTPRGKLRSESTEDVIPKSDIVHEGVKDGHLELNIEHQEIELQPL